MRPRSFERGKPVSREARKIVRMASMRPRSFERGKRIFAI